MKKIFITVSLLLTSCSTHTDIIYSSKKISKSIDNLQTMNKWLKHDLKDGVQVDHYEMLIDQTIYNLERNIKPIRPIKDYSGLLNVVKEQANAIRIVADYGYHAESISPEYYEWLNEELLILENYIKLIEK